jgi:hypothetical protein
MSRAVPHVQWRAVARVATLAVVLSTVVVVRPNVVQAATTPTYKVTMVARWCDSYTDIFGNRARNDIMESLRDLGPNTPYNPFVSIDPAVEDGTSPQSKCHALPNWTFAFGNGYGRPVPGTNLSFVRNPASVNNRQVTTAASTPLLDDAGNPTGGSIAGATTFTLTAAEVSLASQNNRFWAMGGTPTEPLNAQGDTYGFGALRCAKDNLNGDNVEWIAFPSGATHVFCYAFYVKPPPEAGVINIRKQLANGLTLPTSQGFSFDGNLSFNPGGDFTVEVPADTNSATKEFVRGAGGTPWVANELDTPGFVFVSVSCSSANATSTWVATGQSVSISLGAGDTITCTFVNDLEPPPAGAGLLLKQTFGDPYGVPLEALPATWTFDVVDPSSATHTVQYPVDPATGVADSGPIPDLQAGTWTVTERIPAPTAAVRWEFAAAICVTISNGASVTVVEAPAPPSITVVVPAGGRAGCSFINRMVPLSKLTIRLTTLGGTDTFGFEVQGQGDQNVDGTNEGVLLQQQAATATAGTRVVATGDSTDPIYGNWIIAPVIPAATAAGRWEIASAPTCNVTGAAAQNIGPEQLAVDIGANAPDMICDYVYRFVTPSTLDVVKVLAGYRPAQVDPVRINVVCDDGTTSTLTVSRTAASPARLPSPLSFVFPTECSVVEADNGGGGASVGTTTSITVNGAAATRSLSTLLVGSDQASETVVVQFANTYSAVLPASGPGRSLAFEAAVGAFFVAAGLALLTVRRRSSRTTG